MTSILGISAHYHDAAAAIVVDGRIVAAAQEERFTRRKHDPRFPERAIAYCLEEAGLEAGDLNHVAFYDKPLLKFDRYLESALTHAPGGWRSFVRTVPEWLHDRLRVPGAVRRTLPGYRGSIVYTEHHESHAASAFLPSPFEEAAILTIDGVGEWATATRGVGRGNHIELTNELRFPHSLGLLYSAFTEYCGFRVNSGEYKLMGLAPYGTPRFVDVILERIVDLREDGSFRLRQEYLALAAGERMSSRAFHDLFGGPPRVPESEITDRVRDVAASIQLVTEEIVLRMARGLHAETGMSNLCLAGGVALNAVANGRLIREGPFERIWVQPAAGDAGGALGAAMFVWHQLLDRPRVPSVPDGQQGSLLGPEFRADDIRRALDESGVPYRQIEGEDELCRTVAAAIDAGSVVGWFQGRMEFGPRALGARSLLADVRGADIQARMNAVVKRREAFRPFAPGVLAERAAEWFELPDGLDGPYMVHVAPVREERRSMLPAVTHVDGSARLQTVDAERHGPYHRLLVEFERRTGVPILLNTSFNVRGEPIVLSPNDAIRCFLNTEIDLLVLGNFVVERNPEMVAPTPIRTAESTAPETESLFRYERDPSPTFLRTFAIGLVVFFGLLGWWAIGAGHSSLGYALIASGVLLGGTGLVVPTFARRLYLGWMWLLSPVARVVSFALLSAVYFLVVTPIGIVMRWLGHDPLSHRLDPIAESYWIPRTAERRPRDYLRRY